ncbi:MAG: TonB-dependent receptor [Synechococcus sp. SB0666_bin_14]|nr:TonB-dependent receptor [Synechococcus sp. SB0666_bin_14]MYG47653.1 TonB-dependent receptor [Synechococcus sp. SB0675_bin_6]
MFKLLIRPQCFPSVMPFLSSDGNPSLVFTCLTRGVAASVLGFACAAAPLAGLAQESSEDTDPSLDLETITVTGQKSKRSLAETDGSVTVVFPGESGSVTGAADDVFDVVERLANVTPFAASSGIAIRGIGQTGFASGPVFGQTNFLVTRSPGDLVATYVDGIPVSVYAGPFGLWDVDQVEVLRGAQSTVLGRGSLGGAVVIENADPTFTTEAVGQLKVGTEKGGLGTSFSVSGPIVEDRLAYRVAFDRQSGPNFIENTTLTEDGDRQDLLSRRVKLLYTGEGGAELELSTFFSETNVGTHYVDADAWNDGKKITRANPNSHLENHSTGASLRGSWPLGHPSLSLESATVWVREDATSHFDVDQTQYAGNKNTATLSDDIRTFSQELRLRYAGDRFNGFIGAYFEDFQGDGSNKSDVFGRRSVKQDVQTMALFGEGEWPLSEKMDLTVGLRLERENSNTEIDADDIINFQKLNLDSGRLGVLAGKARLPLSQISPANIGMAIQAGRITRAEGAELGGLAGRIGSGTFIERSPIDHELDKEFSVFLPKLGLSYKVSPETRIYSTIQRGYRAGGAGASLIIAEQFEYDPERTWNVDLGVRHRSADGRLQLDSNLFYVDWQDQQFQLRSEDGTSVDFVTQNAGQSKSYGLELDADYQATERLRLFGSLGLLYTEITEATIDSDVVKGWLGNSFTMAPKSTVSAGWSYAFDHGLDFSMAANWRDSAFSDIENTSIDEVDGRLLVDMGIGYQFPDRDLRLDFKVTNVFDTRYLNYSYIQPLKQLTERLQALSSVDPVNLSRLSRINSNGIVSPGNGRAVNLILTARF